MKMSFQPDYNNILQVLHNKRPERLPLYEHHIDLNVDAKHSNEDEIAPFEKWINLYNDRIGLMGGIDVNLSLTINFGVL